MQKARLSVDKNNTPKSVTFDDIYFSSDNPIGESEYVFIEANKLQEKLTINKSLAISELGFGSGLNFLCTLTLKDRLFSPSHLDYFAIEKYPIETIDLEKLLSRFVELSPHKEALIKSYCPIYEGFNILDFPDFNTRLHLYIGDVIEGLEALTHKIDVWFLDGFSPAKNPQMWTQNVMSMLAKKSNTSASLSTFSASSMVRKNLINAGFCVNKQKGFGKKREMLVGFYEKPPCPTPFKPWFKLPQIHSANHDIAIIGAGLSGVSMAYTLATKGVKTSLYDGCQSIAEQTSSLPFAVLKPFLSADCNLSDQYYSAGFVHTYKTIHDYLQHTNHHFAKQCGLIALADSHEKYIRFSKIANRNLPTDIASWVNIDKASCIANLQLPFGGLYYPFACMLNLKNFCHAMYNNQKQNISFIGNMTIFRLEYHKGSWVLFDEKDQVINIVSTLIICNAHNVNQFDQLNFISLEHVVGQISEFQANTDSSTLRCMLSTNRVLCPNIEGKHFIGATYRQGKDTQILNSDHIENQEAFRKIVEFDQAVDAHVQTRATTKDHLPIIGPVANKKIFTKLYSDIKHGDKHCHFPDPNYHSNLYVSVGHGSRGLCSTLLGAEIIAAIITGCSIPASYRVLEKIHPSRLLIKELTL